MAASFFAFAAPGWVLDYGVLGFGLLVPGIVALLVGWRSRRSVGGKIALNLAALLLCAGGVELLAFLTAPASLVERPADCGKSYFTDDADLGYWAKPNSEGRCSGWAGGVLIYDVIYRFDENCARCLPDRPGPDETGSILCFGGSFMEGQGLAEEATVPAQLELALRDRGHDELRPVPLAFQGWGAHQMLALIQSGRVEAMELPEPKVAIYWGIADHVARTSGLRSWDQAGPYFEVTQPGVVERRGQFADLPGHPLVNPKDRGLATVSWAIRRRINTVPKVGPAEIERWAAVVATARRELEERFPGIEFLVFLDDANHGVARHMQSTLEGLGIEATRSSDVLEGYAVDMAPWTLHPLDLHPNSRAAVTIAEHLADQVEQSL